MSTRWPDWAEDAFGQLLERPAVMVRGLSAASFLLAAAGVAMVLLVPWTAFEPSNWRLWPLLILALPARFFAGATICGAAALWIGLLDRLRDSVRRDVRELRRRALAVRRANGDGLG